MNEPGGFLVEHATLRSVVAVVEVPRPYTVPFLCPTCHVTHTNKSVHLWLDGAGRCMVSSGVLAELKSAGMPDLAYVGWVPDPPMLTVGAGVDRAETDYTNRVIQAYK